MAYENLEWVMFSYAVCPVPRQDSTEVLKTLGARGVKALVYAGEEDTLPDELRIPIMLSKSDVIAVAPSDN